MSTLELFLKSLYKHLANSDDIDNNIIRKHTRKLETLGDLSFPLDTKNWHQLRNSKTLTIPPHSETLIEASQSWPLRIDKCIDKTNNRHLFLRRSETFRTAIMDVLNQSKRYGCFDLNENVRLESELSDDDDSLTGLRIRILKTVAKNFIHFNTNNSNESNCTVVLLTSKSKSPCSSAVLCGSVLNATGCKDVATSADAFYKQRTEDMRMMAEHKYGLRVTSKPGWQDFFVKLGNAAVTIELLQNKCSHTATIDVNNHYAKNASFVLYNCARLSTLFKEFHKRVSEGVYPALPEIDNIDFSLLIQAEEWELLYVYILQFPMLIKSCIKDISQCKLNVHYLLSMLSSMTSLFSVYYRRVRVLTDPRSHMFPVLHARIYLLKAVEQILHNSLHLLDIEPIKQM